METIEEIKKLLKQEKNAFVSKRLQIVAWMLEGVDVDEVSERSGKSRSQVYAIYKQYRDEGAEKLKSKNKGGNNRYLSFADEAEYLKEFSEKASKGEFVRVEEMHKQFEEKSKQTYCVNAFYEMLHRHGWRKVKPRGRHPKKASDETIEVSKKLTQLSWI